MELVAVGDANVDFVMLGLEGAPKFGREVVVQEAEIRAGGSAANFALCAARLGARVGFAGMLGIDGFGELVLRAFREAGVDTKWLRLVEEGSTGVTVAMVRRDGERAFLTFQGTNAQLGLEDLRPVLEASPPPRWLHLAGYHLLDKLQGKPSLELLEEARGRGMTTSLDTGWDPQGWNRERVEELRELLQFVDVLFPNEGEVRALTGERNTRQGAKLLLEWGASTVVVKRGARGCMVVTRKDWRSIPGFKVKVVDTTAAGDAFDAGFAVSMLSGETMARAALFANAVAALKISHRPKMPPFPNMQEVHAFLMRRRPLEV